MTPTREQYELAAKAAGIKICFWQIGSTLKALRNDREGHPPTIPWTPHTDRADAFSLLCAIKNSLEFAFVRNVWVARAERLDAAGYFHRTGADAIGDLQHDIEAAAREAIFLCAVEVGRGMA